MNCAGCSHWFTKRQTVYGDGTVIVEWAAPETKGKCDILKIETDEAFGCNRFYPIDESTDHWTQNFKSGSPWQHWVMIPCPDCQGVGNNGNAACHNCAGTAKVRRYDDGYIADERTRHHPKASLKLETDFGTTLAPLPKPEGDVSGAVVG